MRVAAQSATTAAGVNGVLFSLEPAAPSATDRGVVAVDYSAFADAGGANFGGRLKLVQLPACALTTPTVAACRVQRPVKSTNNQVGKTVRTSAPVGLGSNTVLAAVAGASSSQGTFAASNLSPSGSWTAGGSNGGFNWSYPVSVPPPATGADVAPVISLGYSSSSVDGQIATSNNQSSWIGEGWNYEPGYIERTYETCADLSTQGSPSYTQDQCWAGQVVTMNLGGATTALVRDDTTGAWHPADDNGQQITLATGTTNGALNGEYWKITTTNGVSYYFGRNVLPGGTTANATNSTLVEPVYATHSTDPCYNASFASSKCDQAWRWNLDYVVDPHGNAAAYYYTKEDQNYYGADGGTTPVKYDRGALLDHIDYGLREVNGSIQANKATNRITFVAKQRCFAADCSLTVANQANWPDTPVDQACGATGICNNHSPTFWSTRRVSSIQTGYWNGSSYPKVDEYDLAQSFPNTNDIELGLDSISHIGYSTAGAASAPLMVSFISAAMSNRVPNTNGQSDMYFWRVNQVISETGATTVVTYDQPNGQACTASTLPADPANDNQLCYPVKWTPEGYTSPILDYFQKYVVTKVRVQPNDGRSPTQETDYTYLGSPAWHADDNEVVKPANRSYGQFRGYSAVETRTGDIGFTYNTVPDQQTLTRTMYYRGMAGAPVTDSIPGETVPDNNQYAGMVRESQTFNGGDEVSAAITDEATRITTATRVRTGLPALTANIVTAVKTRTITDEPISSTATRAATTVNVFDSLGRIVQQTDSGDDGVATTCTTTSYADPVAGNTRYIRDRVAEKIVSQQSCPPIGTTPTPILSDVRTYYDTLGTTAGVTSYGDATRVDTRVDAGGTATPYFAKATIVYDTAGRLTSSTVHQVNTDAGRTTTTTYFPTLPATPGTAEPLAGPLTKTVVKNPVGQTVTTLFNVDRGLATDVTDVAGHLTHADYDSLGRVTAVWRPGQVHGTDPASSTFSYLVASAGPSSITTKTLIDNGVSKNYKTSVSLLDSFGQPIESQTDAVGGGRVVTDTFRDSHGWPIDTNNFWYDPSTAPTTSLPQLPPDANVDDRTETRYDQAGRPVRATEFTGLTATWHTDTIYGGNQTTVIPPTGGVAQTTVTDSRGETTHLIQYTAAPTVSGNTVTGPSQSTDYGYTPLGQQSSISFAGRQWTSTYDLGGRVTRSSDPDTGITSKGYDDLGELTSSTDMNNVILTYTYDQLGRRTAQYHTATQTAANEMNSWLYDTVQAGQLSSSTHYVNATTKYTVATGSYDSAGNPLSTVVSLPSTETGFAASYTTSYTWTTTHLMASATQAVDGGLPSENVFYAYDTLGNPNGLAGRVTYVGAASYSAYGEPTVLTLGANNQTAWMSYTRDPQTRRITDVLFSAQNAVPQIEDLQYSYDPAGNVTKSVDAEGNGASAPTETQCFNYSALDQLTQAWSANDNCAQNPSTAGVGNSVVGGPQPYWQSWTFNTAGLRSEQVQHAVTGPATGDQTTDYNYTSPGHADFLTSTVSSTGGLVSSYTPNAVGNTTARTAAGANLSLSYGWDNRTASVTSPTGSSSYVNDADGNLLVRHDPGSTTVYLPGEELTRTASTSTIKGTR
ncbi:MAG: type IV secretion protein Rhs, partial [Jatrophihabitantaceae bacterium]